MVGLLKILARTKFRYLWCVVVKLLEWKIWAPKVEVKLLKGKSCVGEGLVKCHNPISDA